MLSDLRTVSDGLVLLKIIHAICEFEPLVAIVTYSGMDPAIGTN